MTDFDFHLPFLKIQTTLSAFLSGPEIRKLEFLGNSLVGCLESGGKLVTFGNGGSAAEASHFTTELVSKCSRDHYPWPSISLSDSSTNLTAIGNDYGFDKIFSRQIEGLASGVDCVIGFSTSGKSPNVINALTSAVSIGCKTFLITGNNYQHNPSDSWNFISVPSSETTRIQEVHLTIIHTLAEYCEFRMMN